MDISVVVVTYRRLKSLEAILAAWLKETPDVWLCDCSREGFKTKLPVNIIHASPDPGNRLRHAVALLTKGRLVIKADDDVMPRAGIAKDFIRCQEITGPAIMGIHGRTFHGKGYYMNTKLYGSKQLKDKPLKVDFVGVITCAPRAYLAFDLNGCNSNIEDLFWQMRCFPKAPKYIIPTDKFHHLAESKDAGRLCATPKDRHERGHFYTNWYNKNYK